MIVPFNHILVLAGLLFMMGIFCVVVRRSMIMILLGVEIMLNAASIIFVGGSLLWQNLEGQAVVLFIFAIAAAEVSVGVDPENYNMLGS